MLAIQAPQIYNYTYLLRSGEDTITVDLTDYLQTPDCRYSPVIESYFSNMSAFNESMIQFEVDTVEKVLRWKVNADNLEDIGSHQIIINYTLT